MLSESNDFKIYGNPVSVFTKSDKNKREEELIEHSINPCMVLQYPNQLMIYVYSNKDDEAWLEFTPPNDLVNPVFSPSAYNCIEPVSLCQDG